MLTVTASPQVGFAPAHLVVRSTIEASDDNRAIQVIVDSEDFYRSSTIELEGSGPLARPSSNMVVFRRGSTR